MDAGRTAHLLSYGVDLQRQQVSTLRDGSGDPSASGVVTFGPGRRKLSVSDLPTARPTRFGLFFVQGMKSHCSSEPCCLTPACATTGRAAVRDQMRWHSKCCR